MDYLRIPIFKRFSVASIILPYFGSAHRSFLILSSLCIETRNMLDEYFAEFIKVMAKYTVTINIYKDNLYCLSLPSCLFKFKLTLFNLSNNLIVNEFIKLIENTSQGKGYYFKDHFMNEIMIMDDILIDLDTAENLLPYIEIMKNIKASFDSYLEDEQKSTLFHKIILKREGLVTKPFGDADSYKSSIFDKFDEQKCSIFEYFKRVDSIDLDESNSFTKTIEENNFNCVYIDKLTLSNESLKRVELNNSFEILKGKINHLKYVLDSDNELTKQIIEKFCSINPKTIEISLHYEIVIGFNLIRLINQVSENIKVSLEYDFVESLINVIFKDTVINIYEPKTNKSVNLNCEMLSLFINLDDLIKFKVLNEDSDDVDSKIMLVYSNCLHKIELINSKKSLKESKISFLNNAYKDLDLNDQESCIIAIPIKSLNHIEVIDDYCFVDSNITEITTLFKNLSTLRTMKCFLQIYNFKMFENWSAILPINCEYVICKTNMSNYYQETNLMRKLIESEGWLQNYLRIAEKLKIKSLQFYHAIKDNLLELINNILILDNVQNELETVELTLCNLSDCILILDNCSQCKRTKKIQLFYYNQDYDEELMRKKILEFIVTHDASLTVSEFNPNMI